MRWSALGRVALCALAGSVCGCAQPEAAIERVERFQTAPLASSSASDFVKIMQGPIAPVLAVGGKPWRMLGYEGWVANPNPPYSFCGWTAQQLTQSLQDIATRSHGNVMRMWFLQSAGGPNNWTYFDSAIAQAKALGIRIIPALVNQWGACEPQVGSNENYKTINWYLGGYKQANDGYSLAYRDYAIAVAKRYANEPTIAFWQLVNEAEARDYVNNTCPNEQASAAAIRAFADDMVSAIHTVDTNHLINLGTQDLGFCGVSDNTGYGGDDFAYVQAGSVDICEVHTYDPPFPAMPAAVAPKLAACLAMGKPVFTGEVGFCRVANSDGSCDTSPDPNVVAASLQRRAQYYRDRFIAGFNAGMSGMLIWEWSPGQSDTTYGVWVPDPAEVVMRKFSPRALNPQE